MAVVSLETRSQLGELIKGVGVQFMDVYNQSLNSYSLALDDLIATPGNKYTAIAKQERTDAAISHFIQKTGTAYLQVTPEGSAFNTDSRILGYKTSVTNQLFSNSITVTYQALQDRDYKQALDEFRDLTIAGKETMDRNWFEGIFNFAFSAQTSLPIYTIGYGDGKPLCSTVHPRKDAGTAQSNASATGITFGDDNLETGRIALARQLDDRGKPIRIGGKLVLVVPTELEKQAVFVTKSVKRAGTANNDINIYDGIVTVVATNWVALTGNGGSLPTTAWYLIDPRVSKLIFLLREGLKTHTFTDPNTLAQTFYIISRFAVTYVDWRGVWGSKGDGLAYSN